MAIVLINEIPTEVGSGADEIIRLREELASAEKVCEGLIKWYTGLAEDAKRYRWLKDNCALGIKQNGIGWSLNTRQCVAPDCMKELDAAIDEAVKENGK